MRAKLLNGVFLELLEFAKQLATNAGKIVRDGYYSELVVEKKAEMDFVTRIDRESEQFIRSEIAKKYPKHGFLGEESGSSDINAEYVWVVDPLDGTTNFIHKIPYFAVSIALKHKGETIVGVVYNPMTDEMFYADKGKGAFMNENKLLVKKPGQFEKWFLAHCFRDISKHEEAERIVFDAFYYHVARVAKLGSAALELCYAASSRVDGYIGLSLKEWDYAAGKLIVEEAGGSVMLDRLIGKDVIIAGERDAVSLMASKILHHNEFMDKHSTG